MKCTTYLKLCDSECKILKNFIIYTINIFFMYQIAHTIVGSLRTFLTYEVQHSLQTVLFSNTIGNHNVFMNVNLDCAKMCLMNKTIGDLYNVLHNLPIRSLRFHKSVIPPKSICSYNDRKNYFSLTKKNISVIRYYSFYYQYNSLKMVYKDLIQYEISEGKIFDIVIRSRPDLVWWITPPLYILNTSIAKNILYVPTLWKELDKIYTNGGSIIEDHVHLFPRNMAKIYFNSIDAWDTCHPLSLYVKECPFPSHNWQIRNARIQSECMLGIYLSRTNNIKRKPTQNICISRLPPYGSRPKCAL